MTLPTINADLRRLQPELRISYKKASEKLVSLYTLLDQLGWLIASEDPNHADTFALRMRTLAKFGKTHISRIELENRIHGLDSRNFLCRSKHLIIWRESKPEPQKTDTAKGLTKRESEVKELLLSGMALPAIATDLGISQRTVEKHVENLYRKLGVHSYNELVFGKSE